MSKLLVRSAVRISEYCLSSPGLDPTMTRDLCVSDHVTAIDVSNWLLLDKYFKLLNPLLEVDLNFCTEFSKEKSDRGSSI